MTSRTYVFDEWHPTDLQPGAIVDLDDEDGWTQLRQFYMPEMDGQERSRQAGAAAFDRVMDVARLGGSRAAFIEFRYIDVDFRSEFNHFYGSTFRRYPSVCHRVHFFREPLTDELSNLSDVALSYVGYTTIRPLESSPIGRTMLPPPPYLESAALCVTEDRVHLRGVELTARGMPFTSQDGQYLRCSHSSLWMAATFSHLARATPRFLPDEIHEAAKGGALVGRERPHEGLSVNQLLSAVHTLGFSGPFITFPESKAASKTERARSLPAQLCRYLNGRVPIIVYNMSHAWLVVGYYYEGAEEPSHDSARFVVHDDILGPYLTAAEGAPHHDPWRSAEHQKRWRGGIAVLPPKIYISGEKAELLGRERLEVIAADNGHVGALSYRTYLMSGVEFKASLRTRDLPEALASLHLDTHLPRHVWVVEAIDENASLGSRNCVVGETVIDCTANHLASADSSALLAIHFEHHFKATSLDFGQTRVSSAVPYADPYETGVPVPVNPRRIEPGVAG